jgi:hypothetical protein
MEQIDGHWVSLSCGVAQGLAHGLISYGQSHEMKSHFGISATGNSKDTGSLFHCIGKPRNAKCENPFRHFGYREFKRHGVSLPLHWETLKCKMRKDVSANSTTGTSKDRGSLFHCIEKPRNAKCEKPFQHFGYQDFKRHGVSLFHCIGKP